MNSRRPPIELRRKRDGGRSASGGPPDFDGDGNVGTGDLILLLGSWGDPYGKQDLIELLGNWGPCPK